jgi:hypothetical protein
MMKKIVICISILFITSSAFASGSISNGILAIKILTEISATATDIGIKPDRALAEAIRKTSNPLQYEDAVKEHVRRYLTMSETIDEFFKRPNMVMFIGNDAVKLRRLKKKLNKFSQSITGLFPLLRVTDKDFQVQILTGLALI